MLPIQSLKRVDAHLKKQTANFLSWFFILKITS